eukprot:CAMPEP_0194132594 /NCGR_PEP_ID=MMETSP0152-20130528/3022_1 /TAXON_ID=1049557 /ORGANISM="Thalassiothrix antarctica, Strain L6-D1" /LENGTH=566 /DNA_ID=CAMNT_0038827695 /DNA_START=82 /DNA_END=1782 /DNA_ORIENTATION=-
MTTENIPMATGQDVPGKDEKYYLMAKRALTAVNFFVESSRLEHYTAVYLINILNWKPSNFGIVSLLMNMVMVIFQTPAGDLLDKLKNGKRTITGFAIIIAAVTTVMVVWTSNFWAILVGKIIEGMSSTIFLPALMSLLLGISRSDVEVPSFIATTEVSNKIGSFLLVSACGCVSYFAYPNIEAMFYLLGACGLAAAFFTFIIPESSIDHKRARQLDESGGDKEIDLSVKLGEDEAKKEEDDEASGPKKASPRHYIDILKERDILLFAVLTFTYHLANAGIAPLLAQYVASITSSQAALAWTSANLGLFFVVQALTAYLMIYAVDRFDHKRIMTVAFFLVPIRCLVVALMAEYFNNPWALTATQTLDGIGAGVYDIMILIIVHCLTKGSGRFGFTFGFIISMWRIGHGASIFLGEHIVQHFDYTLAFGTLGAIGLLNLIVFVFFFQFKSESAPAEESAMDKESTQVEVEELQREVAALALHLGSLCQCVRSTTVWKRRGRVKTRILESVEGAPFKLRSAAAIMAEDSLSPPMTSIRRKSSILSLTELRIREMMTEAPLLYDSPDEDV